MALPGECCPSHLAQVWPGLAIPLAPPSPAPRASQATATLRAGMAPLGMNGHSEAFQRRQPSHKGQWERENPSSSSFSHIMANNRAIQWRVGPLSRLLGTAGVAFYFSAVLASGQEPGCSRALTVGLLLSSLPNVPVTRKCHQPTSSGPNPGPKEAWVSLRTSPLTFFPEGVAKSH